MTINPKSLENLKSYTKRSDGLATKVHRISATVDAHQWFGDLSAEGRGNIITAAMESRVTSDYVPIPPVDESPVTRDKYDGLTDEARMVAVLLETGHGVTRLGRYWYLTDETGKTVRRMKGAIVEELRRENHL